MTSANRNPRDPMVLDYIPRALDVVEYSKYSHGDIQCRGEGSADIYERIIVNINGQPIEAIVVGVSAPPLRWEAIDYKSFLASRTWPAPTEESA